MGVSDFIRNRLYDFVKYAVVRLLLMRKGIEVIGKENFYKSNGPYLMVSSHSKPNSTWIFEEILGEGKRDYHRHTQDPYLLGGYTPLKDRIKPIIQDEVYNDAEKGALCKALQFIPAKGTNLVKKVKSAIERGYHVVIFPEGETRNVTLTKRPNPERGVGTLVRILDNVKIMPINLSLWGKQDTWKARFNSARVIYGEPRTYREMFGDIPSYSTIDEKREVDLEIAKNIMDKVYSLEDKIYK